MHAIAVPPNVSQAPTEMVAMLFKRQPPLLYLHESHVLCVQPINQHFE